MCEEVRGRLPRNNPGKDMIKPKTRKSERKKKLEKKFLGSFSEVKKKSKNRRKCVNIISPLTLMAEETYNGAIGYIRRILYSALTFIALISEQPILVLQ